MNSIMLASSVTTLFTYLISFVVALTVIVFIHEFGHFIVGRWCGIKVEVFSVGFGRELFGFTDSHGTRWKFCPWPLGGYVRFEGDANAASMPDNTPSELRSPTSFPAQPVWKRAAVVIAGPAANFILAIAIFAAAFSLIGMPYMEPVVDEVLAGSSAQKAGLKPGDRFISIDGKEVLSFGAVQEAVWMRPGEELAVIIDRAGQSQTLMLVPQIQEQPDNFGGKIRVGILGVKHLPKADEPKYRRFAPHMAVLEGVDRTWYIVKTTGKFIGKLFSGQQSLNQIGGAASIAKGAGDAASGGMMSFVYFIGLLSVSIGLINLFPIPMLDGGHLIFFVLEALRGKPLGQQAQEWGYRIGLSFVAMLMLVGVFNDAGRIINVVFGT